VARKPGIPSIPKPGDDRSRFDSAVKESLETIMGRRGVAVTPLAEDASLSDVIAKLNDVIELLQ
jgi:hypothetical protein